MSKKVKTKDDAWDAQETYSGLPHGWVQWKGTDACMDIHCSCGHLGHVDDYFAYYVKCPKCGKQYFVNGHVELIEVEELEDENIIIAE